MIDHDELELLSTANPEPEKRRDINAVARTAEIIARAQRPPQRRASVPRRSRLQLRIGFALLAGAAIAVAIVATSGVRPDTSSAQNELEATARVAARAPATDQRTGRYAYRRTRSAALVIKASRGGPWSYLEGVTREEWVDPSGEGRVRETVSAPIFLGSRDRRRAAAAQFREPTAQTTNTRDANALPHEGVERLPTDVKSLEAVIRRRARSSDESRHTEMLVIVSDLLRDPAASPRLRAALYRVAARLPGIRRVGNVRDPAGRRGVAVAITSSGSGNRERQELIFDPRTSAILAEETVLLERVGYVD